MLAQWNQIRLSSSTQDNKYKIYKKSPELCSFGDFCFKYICKCVLISCDIFFEVTKMQDIVLDSKVKIQTKKKNRWFGWFVNLIMISLLLGLLYGLDFVLYVRSGTVSVFDGAWNPAVVWIFSAILLTAFTIMVLCCFSKKLQSFVFALLVVFLIFGFMHQFLVLDTQQYLSVLFASLFGYNALQFVEEYVSLIIGLIIFVGCYSLSMHLSNRNKSFLVGILLAINAFLLVQAKMEKNTDENIPTIDVIAPPTPVINTFAAF